MKENFTLRSYEAEDEARVLQLLQAALGDSPVGPWSKEFFRWKHLENPFGRSFVIMCEENGELIGLRIFMRWEFKAGATFVRAARAVDTATHPDHQRRGIFSVTTAEGLKAMRDEVDFIFNTPNDKSLPGYLKLGWQTVTKFPLRIRIKSLRNIAAEILRRGETRGDGQSYRRVQEATDGISNLTSASEMIQDQEEIESFLKRIRGHDPRLATTVSHRYLLWRYTSCPGIRYQAIRCEEQSRLRGLLFYRIRERRGLREATIGDVLVEAGDTYTARNLLSQVIKKVDVDHITCHFPRKSAQGTAARRSLFIPARHGIRFVVNPLTEDLPSDPRNGRSWALTLGDLELF